MGHWLAEHVDGLAGPVEFGLVSGGRSNLTYRLTDAGRRLLDDWVAALRGARARIDEFLSHFDRDEGR